MKIFKSNSKGFGHLELLAMAVFVLAFAGTAYLIHSHEQNKSVTHAAANVTAAPSSNAANTSSDPQDGYPSCTGSYSSYGFSPCFIGYTHLGQLYPANLASEFNYACKGVYNPLAGVVQYYINGYALLYNAVSYPTYIEIADFGNTTATSTHWNYYAVIPAKYAEVLITGLINTSQTNIITMYSSSSPEGFSSNILHTPFVNATNLTSCSSPSKA
jgi:hypothetical protein